MIKLLLITFSSLIFSLTIYSQDNTIVVDKVATKICNDLKTVENIDSLSDYEAKIIIGRAILEYKNDWENELDKIENSRNAGQTVFDYLLNHRLQQECDNFKAIDNKLDNYLTNNSDFRGLYLTVKDLVLSAESDIETEILTNFFDPELDKSELIERLEHLKKVLNLHKRLSGLYIMKRDNLLYFYVNVFDYKTGDENVAIMISFDDLDDNLIDEWDFKTKEELEAERQVEEDYDEMEIVPITPPSDN